MVDVSVSAPQTPLIEPEETPISLTIQLSEPPPPGGLRVPFNVSIDGGAAKPLAQFNLNSFSFDNASLAQLPNTDTLNSFELIVTGQTATINLQVRNDDFEEGTDNVTFSIAESPNFNIAPGGGSTTVTIEDEPPEPEPEPEPEPPVGEVSTVGFEMSPDSLNEEEEGNLSLNFTVDREVPEDGITLNLNGALAAVLDNQFNLGEAEATGLEILPPGGEAGGEAGENGADGNRLYGGENADELEVLDGGDDNRLFAGAGNDFIELSLSGEGNRAYAGEGDDFFSLGSNDRAFGNDGDDIFLMQGGGNGSMSPLNSNQSIKVCTSMGENLSNIFLSPLGS